GGANFLARTGSAEMLGDGGDVKLVDGGFLLARLAAPIGGGVAQEHGLGMTGGKGARRRIEEQVFGKGAFGFGNRGEARDAFGVDDGEIEAGLRAVIQEHGIDDFARAGGKAEGDVGNTEHGADVRKLLLDEANAFDRLDGAADIIFVAGGAGEDEGIEDDVGRGDRVFFGEQAAGALGDFEFALSREGLRLELVFVNAADDERGAIGARERADALEFFLAVLEIDGVDDALALAIGEGEFDGAGVRGVDHERGFNFAYELFVEGRHVLEFVALGALEADVNDMRAAFHLAAGDFGGFLPLVGGDEIFEQARADYVGAFADDERAGAVFGFDDLDAGIYGAMIRLRCEARQFALGHLRDGANVLLRGATAAADDIKPAAIGEALELLGERRGRLGVEALLVWQAGVGIAGDRARGERLQGANVVGHELGAGGAI